LRLALRSEGRAEHTALQPRACLEQDR